VGAKLAGIRVMEDEQHGVPPRGGSSFCFASRIHMSSSAPSSIPQPTDQPNPINQSNPEEELETQTEIGKQKPH